MVKEIKKKMIKYNVYKIMEIIEAYIKQYTQESIHDEVQIHLLYKYLRNLVSSSTEFDRLKEFLEKGEFVNLSLSAADKNEIRGRSTILLNELSNFY